MGTVMLVIALLQWLCSTYSDARALRIFAWVYLLTGLGWLTAHPRAHGGADDVPLLPALVAVALLGMNVWGLYEFLGLARRRAWALVAGTLAVGAGLALWLQQVPDSAHAVYGVMAGAFGYCAWLALARGAPRGQRRPPVRGRGLRHLPAAVSGCTVALPQSMAGFEMGYYAAVPAMIVGMMVLAVSLIRARRRSEIELQRRISAEESLRQLNATLEQRVGRAHARAGTTWWPGCRASTATSRTTCATRWPASAAWRAWVPMALEPRRQRRRRPLPGAHRRARPEQLTGMVQDLLQLSRVSEAPLHREHHALGRCVDAALAQLRLVRAGGRGAAAPAARACSRCRHARSTPT